MPLRFWRDWLLLWASIPVVSSVFSMALGKTIDETSPYASLHWWATIAAILLSIFVFAIGPYIALKRHFPRNFDIAYIGIMASICVTTLTWSIYGQTGWLRELNTGFSKALVFQGLDFAGLLFLPWWRIALISCLEGLVLYAIPIAILCLVTKKHSPYFKVLLFVLVGCFAAEVAERMFYLTGVVELHHSMLNGRAWSLRIATIALWSVSSMIGASISAIGISKLLPDRDKRSLPEQASDVQWEVNSITLTSATIILLWGGSYVMNYSLGPQGLSSGFPQLRYALSSAPAKDEPSGSEILQFSHKLNAQAYKWPNPYYSDVGVSPDGKHVLVLEQERQGAGQWAAFDLTSGKRTHKMGEPLKNGGRSSLLWTSDSNYLVINRRGKAHRVGISTYYQTQLVLYSLPDFSQKANWVPEQNNCFHRFGLTKVMHETAKGTLMLMCTSPALKGDLLAVELSIPKLEEKRHRYVSNREADHEVDLSFKDQGTVYGAMRPKQGNGQFLISDLSFEKNSVVIDEPLADDRGGKLTFQGFELLRDNSASIGMNFCGNVDDVSNPPDLATQTDWGPSFCRLLKYNSITGALVNFKDLPETRGIIQPDAARYFTLKTADWEITGLANQSSKAGKLVVRDISSGNIVQTIRTTMRIPLRFSDNGKQLFTLDATDRSIAVYHLTNRHNHMSN